MVPLLKFYFHEDVRIAAVQSLPELLRAATLAVEKGSSPDPSMPAQMLDFFWQPLLDAMHKVCDASLLFNPFMSATVACALGTTAKLRWSLVLKATLQRPYWCDLGQSVHLYEDRTLFCVHATAAECCASLLNCLVCDFVQEPDTEVLVSMLTSIEEILTVAGPELLSIERLGQALGALQVRFCRVVPFLQPDCFVDTTTVVRHVLVHKTLHSVFDLNHSHCQAPCLLAR